MERANDFLESWKGFVVVEREKEISVPPDILFEILKEGEEIGAGGEASGKKEAAATAAAGEIEGLFIGLEWKAVLLFVNDSNE